jgi:hypothetical protein
MTTSTNDVQFHRRVRSLLGYSWENPEPDDAEQANALSRAYLLIYNAYHDPTDLDKALTFAVRAFQSAADAEQIRAAEKALAAIEQIAPVTAELLLRRA